MCSVESSYGLLLPANAHDTHEPEARAWRQPPDDMGEGEESVGEKEVES